MGDSLQCYTRAVEIRKSVLGDRHEDVADTLQCMGNVHCVQEHLEEALECFQLATDIREEMAVYDIDMPNYDTAQTVSNGLLDVTLLLKEYTPSNESKIHNYTKMIEIYEEILPIQKILSSQNHTQISNTLYRMGQIYLLLLIIIFSTGPNNLLNAARSKYRHLPADVAVTVAIL